MCFSGEQQNIFFVRTKPARCSQSSVTCYITMITKRIQSSEVCILAGHTTHILATFAVFSLRICKEIEVTKANVVHKYETGKMAASIL